MFQLRTLIRAAQRPLLLLFVFASAALAETAAPFDSANQLYDQRKYPEAERQYEQLISSGQAGANVYYNLGNTEFRLGAPGRAILDYERALFLQPSHPEARANLALVRNQTAAKSLPASWIDRIRLRWPIGVYTIIAAAAFWVFVFSVALMRLRRRGDSAALWTACAAALLLGCYAGVVVWRDAQLRSMAIITDKETLARLAPADSAAIAEPLPAGSQVNVLSERGDWVYCELPSQGRGWIPSAALEKVRLHAS